MFKCEFCSQECAKICNMYRHCRVQHPDNDLTETVCPECTRSVLTISLNKHLASCDGIAPLQCPKCLEMFDTKKQKDAHRKNPCGQNAERASTSATATAAINVGNTQGNVSVNNVTRSNNNTTINNTVINVDRESLPQVLDFFATNKKSVILFIQDDPCKIQMAYKFGMMHEALTAVTHFTGPKENRNIIKMYAKTTMMKVLQDGEPIKIPLCDGLDEIMRNNHSIANSPEVKKFLTSDPTVDVLPFNIDQLKRQRRGMRLVGENCGAFGSKIKQSVPNFRSPKPVPSHQVVELIYVVMVSLDDTSFKMSENNPELLAALKEPMVIACGIYTHVIDEWFKGTSQGGWELCRNAPDMIRQLVHHIQQETIIHLARMRVNFQPESAEAERLTRMSDAMCRLKVEDLSSEIINDFSRIVE